MKTLKKYDFTIQVILIIGFTIASFLQKDYSFIVGYFVVGGWQVISMVMHVLKSHFDEKGTRRYYYNITVATLAMLTLIGILVTPLLMLVLYFLLFSSPIIACYYAWICYDEVYHKMQRPLYQLK